MKVNRDKLLKPFAILLLICVVFSGFFFIQAILSPEVVEKNVLVGEYTQVGKIDYSAKLKPNLIYGRDEIRRGDIVYSALLESMEVNYFFSVSPSPEKINGSYTITLLLTPLKGEWEKELGKYRGEVDASSFTISVPLDWNPILAMWKEIENETKYDFGDPNVRLIVDIGLNFSLFGSNVEERFLQSSNITYAKTISFSEMDKIKKGAIYSKVSSTNTMRIFSFPVEVRDARLISGLPFFAFTCLLGLVGFVERKKFAGYISNRKEKSFERKFRNRIVGISDFPDYPKVFRVSSLRDVAKLSHELEKPILKARNAFAVVDGDTIYVYDDNRGNNTIDRKK